MALVDIREQFVRLSGRHDLVVDFSGGDFSNNPNNLGADFFINSGQRMLDRKLSFAKSYAWYKKDVAIGEFKIDIPYCTAVKQVYMMGSDGKRIDLVRRNLRWMKITYTTEQEQADVGIPIYYTPIINNLAPTQDDLESTNYTNIFTNDAGDIMFVDENDNFLYKGIWWMPPLEKAMTVSVLGRFYSKKLVNDSDKSYWTEVHPDILLLASLYSLERFYRNREGMNDYMSAINDAAIDLDKDIIEGEVQDINEWEV